MWRADVWENLQNLPNDTADWQEIAGTDILIKIEG
jgi:hypothetical protein